MRALTLEIVLPTVRLRQIFPVQHKLAQNTSISSSNQKKKPPKKRPTSIIGHRILPSLISFPLHPSWPVYLEVNRQPERENCSLHQRSLPLAVLLPGTMRKFQNGIQPRKNISVEIPEQRGPVQTAFIWNFLSTLPVLQKPHFLVNGAMFPRRCLSPLDLGVPCLNTMAQGFGFGLLIPGSWDGSFFFLGPGRSVLCLHRPS